MVGRKEEITGFARSEKRRREHVIEAQVLAAPEVAVHVVRAAGKQGMEVINPGCK